LGSISALLLARAFLRLAGCSFFRSLFALLPHGGKVAGFLVVGGGALGFNGYIDISEQACALAGRFNQHADSAARVVPAFELHGLFSVNRVFGLVVVRSLWSA
jgi:hypothetical protein